MGVFDDIKSTIGSAANPFATVGNRIWGSGSQGGQDATNFGKNLDPLNPWPTNRPDQGGGGVSMDDEVRKMTDIVRNNLAQQKKQQDLLQQKQQQASDFRSGIPQLEGTLTRQYQRDSHNQLAQQLAQIRRDSSRRGLFYSGARIGGEAKAEANAGANLAEMRAQLHSGALSQADQLDKEAIDSGITQMEIQQQLNDNIYNQALKNLAAKNAGMAGIGAGIGGLAGTAAGSKKDG